MKSDFDRSNEIESVTYKRFQKFYYKDLMESGDSFRKRQRNAQNLMDYLCDKFKIEHVKVYVKNLPQPSRKKGRRTINKVYALYYFKSCSIKIFNLTAVREQVISINVFYDNLIHEFMHHYDVKYLGIKSTPHSVGFHSRVEDLKAKLKGK